jgi:septal ring factor EnvC (AmiA/AmiB activator)
MNRVLQWINLLGVLALAGLCAVQWSVNRRLNLTTQALERTRIEHEAKIAEQAKTIRNQAADLDEFRTRVRLSEDALADAEKKLQAMQSERDQLAASLEQWKAAVTQRDIVIKQAAAEIQKALDERDAAVKQFNDLATKYNAMVKDK